jgi:acyl-CoA dehydrogenase
MTSSTDRAPGPPLERTLPGDDLQDAAFALVREACGPIAARAAQYDESGEVPLDNLRLLAEIGLTGAFLTEEYGGTGLPYAFYVKAVREVSRACASTGITWATAYHASIPVMQFGTREQQQRYLPGIAAGGLGALAITEATGGSDALALTSTLVADGAGGYVLNGSKVFITNGDIADFLVVFAIAPEHSEDRRRSLTAVLVDANTPGLVVARREKKLGHRASSTAELTFDHCRLAPDSLLDGLGGGYTILLSTLNMTRPSVSAQALGIARAALDEIVSYTNERRQFGQRILDFQGVQFTLADLATRYELSSALLDQVAMAVDAGQSPDDVKASMLKVAASDLAMDAATAAVQLHGGLGYMSGSTVERLFRDAKVTQIWEGANELHRARIGKSFLQRLP